MSLMSPYPDPVAMSVQPFGYATATVTEASHVYVEFTECLIHGVLYRATLHMNLWADGVWRLGLEKDAEWTRSRNASYMSRVGLHNGKILQEPTEAARTALYTRVTSAVVKALTLLPADVFRDAEIRKCENAIERAQEEVKKAQDALQAAEDAEHLAQVALHLAQGEVIYAKD